jgi:hypothetical protein
VCAPFSNRGKKLHVQRAFESEIFFLIMVFYYPFMVGLGNLDKTVINDQTQVMGGKVL